MLIIEVALLEKIIDLNDLKSLIEEKSNDLDSIIIPEENTTVQIYNVIPLAILSTFECNNPKGFSKRDVYIQIYEEINRLFRMLDPYKEMGIWGIYYDELQINYIDFAPQLNKVEVSIS